MEPGFASEIRTMAPSCARKTDCAGMCRSPCSGAMMRAFDQVGAVVARRAHDQRQIVPVGVGRGKRTEVIERSLAIEPERRRVVVAVGGIPKWRRIVPLVWP